MQSSHHNHPPSRPHRELPRGFTDIQTTQLLPSDLSLCGLACPLGSRAHQAQNAQLEQRWLDIVGRPAAASPFTIIIPLHNERAILDRTLHALVHSILPSSVPAHIVFVANASSDETDKRIVRLLDRIRGYHLGGVHTQIVGDPGVTEYKKTRIGNIEISCVTTTTPGKLNALAIGQRCAEQRNHRFSICIDGDTFLEPESIARLVRDAYAHNLGSPESPTVAVSGTLAARFPTSASSILKKLVPHLETRPDKEPAPPHFILGCCFAFSNAWFKEALPHAGTVVEDTTMAAYAYVTGKKVIRSNATAWVFSIGTLRDYGRIAERHAQGVLQTYMKLAAYSERVSEFFHDSRTVALIKPFTARLRAVLLPLLRTRPLRSWPFTLGSFVLHEYFWRKGMSLAKQNPDAQTWERCPSTKGER